MPLPFSLLYCKTHGMVSKHAVKATITKNHPSNAAVSQGFKALDMRLAEAVCMMVSQYYERYNTCN